MSVKQRETGLRWQSGRSMVEMIGVLSVIGVLAIGGITGIKYALQLHAENETVNDFNVAVAGAKTLGLEFADERGPVSVEKIVSVPEQNMKGDYFTTNTISPVMVNVEPNGYTVRIAGISKVVCEQIKYGKYGETCAMIGASYEDCGDNPLADVDCEQFDNVKDPEELSNRKSALQLDENYDINFVDAANNYSSLILYFGSSGMNLDDSDEGGNGGGPLGPGDGDDPDINLDDPLIVDASKCTPGTPFLEGQGDKQFEVCCTNAGGEWLASESICCIGALRKYTQKNGEEWVSESSGMIGNAFVGGTANAACCNFAASSLNENPSCCAEAGYEYLNGACCEVEGGQRSGRDANGNPSSSCPSPSGVCSDVRCLDGRWPREVNGGCCCGAEDVSGNVNEACCGAWVSHSPWEGVAQLSYQWINGTCCKVDENGQPTGEDYKGTTTSSCPPPPPPPPSCKNLCPDGTSKPKVVDGVCCCGTTDDGGNVNETCCKDGSGDWHETDGVSVCCENPCAWNETIKSCCSNNFRCLDGKTQSTQLCLCKSGEKAVSTVKNGKDIVLCCEPNSPRGYDSSLPRPAVLPYENACCTDAGGLNEKGTCCKPNTSINLEDGKRKDTCCFLAGGKWKNSTCCVKWSWQFVKEGGGMCHKPSSK